MALLVWTMDWSLERSSFKRFLCMFRCLSWVSRVSLSFPGNFVQVLQHPKICRKSKHLLNYIFSENKLLVTKIVQNTMKLAVKICPPLRASASLNFFKNRSPRGVRFTEVVNSVCVLKPPNLRVNWLIFLFLKTWCQKYALAGQGRNQLIFSGRGAKRLKLVFVRISGGGRMVVNCCCT